MAALIGMLILFFLAMPVLAIIAMVKASGAQAKLKEHELRLNAISRTLSQQIQVAVVDTS